MRRRIAIGILAALLVGALMVVWRHEVTRFALELLVRFATGYQVRIDDQRLGLQHGAFLGVHVSRGGDPVLDAQRVDLYYSLRDLLPGSTHRFGLIGITIDRPDLTIVHRPDGSYNISTPSGGGTSGVPGRPNAVPLRFNVRIRNGSAALVDQTQFYKESRLQRIDNVAANLDADTAGRTHYVVSGNFADLSEAPFHAVGTVDVVRGFAMHHFQAAALPLLTVGNYIINSPAARILAGTARNLDARAYALDVQPDLPINYHVSAKLDLSNGRLSIVNLIVPVESIRGRLQIVDDTFFASRLDGRLAGIPVVASGGIFNFSNPQWRFGITGTGDLRALRSTMAFSRHQPVRGLAHLGLLLEGSVGDPVLVVHGVAARATYGNFPLTNVATSVALHGGVLGLFPMHAMYAGVNTTLRGTLTLGSTVQNELLVQAGTSSDRLPYVNELLRNEPMMIDAVLRGPPDKLGAYGTVVSMRGIDRVAALFSFDPNGIAQVAPIEVNAGYGELAARYRLDRTTDSSAFWLTARGVSLRAPRMPVFPGATLPALPFIDGFLSDGALAGGGTGRDVAIAGHVAGERTTVSGVRFDHVTASFAGNLANASINDAHADGPWGNFDGYGSFGPSRLIARGTYRGTLQGLRQFTGDALAGSGDLSGPMAIEVNQDRVVVQAQDVVMHGAAVHGLPVNRASGTVAFSNGSLHVYSANVDMAGGHVIAAGTYASSPHAPGGSLAIVGAGLNAAALRNIGIPLDAGIVAMSGNLSAGSLLPAFNGGVVVSGGRSQTYPVAGSALVAMSGDSLHLEHAVGALGTTYGFVNGDVGALTSGSPAYDLRASVPAGDVANALATLQLPGYMTNGTFNAQLTIGGNGLDPSVSGPVNLPAGDVNGLPFVDAHGLLTADRTHVRADAGSALVGTTRTWFAVSAGGAAMSFSLRAPQATFSDFNDFFDTGDTLAGRGSVALAASVAGRRVATSGALSVFGFRYRSLPIGDTAAHWSSTRNALRGSLEVGGSRGVLHVGGTVALAPANLWQNVITRSRYDLNATLGGMDLQTWLPAFGYPELPITGHVSGNAHIGGRYPHLAVSGVAHLAGGTVGRLPIDRADIALTSQGDRVRIKSAELTAPGLAASAEGSFGLAPTAPLNVSVHAVSSDVPKLVAQAAKVNVNVTGTVEATAQVTGSFAKPAFAAAFDSENLNAYGVAFKSIFGSARLHGQKIELRNAGATFAHGSATLAGYLPLQMQPLRIGPRQEPVSFDLQLLDVDPGAFDALLGHNTKLGGSVGGHVGIHGTIGAPHIFGQVTMNNGAYLSDLERAPITGGEMAITFDRSTATLQRLSANLGSGSVKASGRIVFTHGFGRYGDTRYSVVADAHRAQLDLPQYGRGTLDANLRFERTPPGIAHLVGDATATDAVIPFAAFLAAQSASQSSASSGAAPAFDTAFDLGVTAGPNVRVRGGSVAAGLDIGAAGTAHLGGTLSAPTLAGRFDATGGTLTYFDRAFRLREGHVTFTPADGVMPTLHAVGTTHVVNPDPNSDRNPYGSADVTVTIDGQLGNLHVGLDSNPPGYTSDQVLGLIAPFGGFVQGISFDASGQAYAPGLSGANGNAAVALPGALVARQTQSGMLSVSQEAFNILNAQFMTGLLSPLETTLGKGLGLQDVSLTLNYYGSVGLNVRRGIGRFLSAVYATTFGIPQRESFGLEYAPNDSTTAQLTFFFQNGPTPLFNPAGTNISTNLAVTASEPLQGQSGFSFAYRHLIK